LHLQLKRFEFDFENEQNVKINDRFEFSEHIDLTKYLDPGAPAQPKPIYTLWAVLVHYGSVHGGHYYVFIRQPKDRLWYRCDDDIVESASVQQAVDENFGVNPDVDLRRRNRDSANAYMLVYVRDEGCENVVYDLRREDIPKELCDRMDSETEEMKKNAEAAAAMMKEQMNSYLVQVCYLAAV